MLSDRKNLMQKKKNWDNSIQYIYMSKICR